MVAHQREGGDDNNGKAGQSDAQDAFAVAP